jgi:uncharacterized protein (DUF433 family)
MTRSASAAACGPLPCQFCPVRQCQIRRAEESDPPHDGASSRSTQGEADAFRRSACDSPSYTPATVNPQFDRITVDPDRLGGKPCIRELRISVGMVVQMVAAGKTTDEILAEYPYLEAEDVKQALAYSAALAENEYHLVLRPSA